jgi:hypothetical protein
LKLTARHEASKYDTGYQQMYVAMKPPLALEATGEGMYETNIVKDKKGRSASLDSA